MHMLRAEMRPSVEAAGLLLAMAMLNVAMLTMFVLPVRCAGAPSSAVVPTSSNSAVLAPLPSCPSWKEIGSMQIQPKSRLYDLALSEINSASAAPLALFVGSASSANSLLVLAAVIPLAWLAMYVLGAVLQGLARGSLRLAVFMLTATLKCGLCLLNAAICVFKIILNMTRYLLSVPLYLLKMAVCAPFYALSAACRIPGKLLNAIRGRKLPPQPEPQPQPQPEPQPQPQPQPQPEPEPEPEPEPHPEPEPEPEPEPHPRPHEQPEPHPEIIDMRSINLDAMTIAQLKNLVILHFGYSDEFWKLLNNRKATKADYVAYARQSLNQM